MSSKQNLNYSTEIIGCKICERDLIRCKFCQTQPKPCSKCLHNYNQTINAQIYLENDDDDDDEIKLRTDYNPIGCNICVKSIIRCIKCRNWPNPCKKCIQTYQTECLSKTNCIRCQKIIQKTRCFECMYLLNPCNHCSKKSYYRIGNDLFNEQNSSLKKETDNLDKNEDYTNKMEKIRNNPLYPSDWSSWSSWYQKENPYYSQNKYEIPYYRENDSSNLNLDFNTNKNDNNKNSYIAELERNIKYLFGFIKNLQEYKTSVTKKISIKNLQFIDVLKSRKFNVKAFVDNNQNNWKINGIPKGGKVYNFVLSRTKDSLNIDTIEPKLFHLTFENLINNSLLIFVISYDENLTDIVSKNFGIENQEPDVSYIISELEGLQPCFIDIFSNENQNIESSFAEMKWQPQVLFTENLVNDLNVNQKISMNMKNENDNQKKRLNNKKNNSSQKILDNKTKKYTSPSEPPPFMIGKYCYPTDSVFEKRRFMENSVFFPNNYEPFYQEIGVLNNDVGSLNTMKFAEKSFIINLTFSKYLMNLYMVYKDSEFSNRVVLLKAVNENSLKNKKNLPNADNLKNTNYFDLTFQNTNNQSLNYNVKLLHNIVNASNNLTKQNMSWNQIDLGVIKFAGKKTLPIELPPKGSIHNFKFMIEIKSDQNEILMYFLYPIQLFHSF